jgi:hypothetical protein
LTCCVIVTNLNLPSESESVMKHAQADYINAGYKYEKANSADKARAVAEGIRKMLEEEDIKDQADARHLVGRGRQEARETA